MESLLDPNNPNLDGDFIALLQIKQEKEKNKSEPKFVIEQTDELDDAAIPENDVLRHEAEDVLKAKTLENTQLLNSLREELFKACQNNDLDKARETIGEIEVHKQSLRDPELRREEDGATAIHVASLAGSDDVTRYLICSQSESVLVEDMDVVVRKVPSKKSCLHILAEKDNMELVKLLLKQLPEGKSKKEFMNRGVLSELEGQRPRHLSALHIAALRGNTQLLEYLVQSGMDVNSTNSKNDTAILWAARWNHIACVRRLIQLGSDPNHQNDKGSSPLYWAVRYGFPDMVRVLATEGKADITQTRKLGLVSPIVLAAAYGYGEILEILIEVGADVNTRITNSQVGLHFAAMMGHDDVIHILGKHRADIDAADDTGNTALLFAAKAGHLTSIEALIHHGANIDAINKLNESIWYFAIQSPDNDLLKIFLVFYRRVKRMSGRKIIFSKGKTPLHVAASVGSVDKLRCLLDLGASPECVDLNGNTFFHLSARENKIDILNAFITSVDVNAKNSDGDTALHLASREGHIEAMKLLLKKAKLDIPNDNGFIPLHTAVKSAKAMSEAVALLVDAIVTTTNWSLVDARDIHGNTALHVAALASCDEVVDDLVCLNPSLLNDFGENPLHVAAKLGHSSTLAEMLQVFDRPGKGLDLNQQNSEGETLLHICAKRGDAAMVRALIAKGADLSKRNWEGNTVLHEIAEETTIEAAKTEALLEVYDAIVDGAALWWCLRESRPHPDEESESYRKAKKEAMLDLSNDVYNFQGLHLLGFCTSIGAVDMLQAILGTNGVYRCKDRENKMYVYDVTNLTPATCPNTRKPFTSKASASVDVVHDDPDYVKPVDKSCLDLIAGMQDEVLATQLLDVTPIAQLVKNLWKAFQWLYLVLMIIHLTYMGCFTSYSLRIVAGVWNTSGDQTDPVVTVALNPQVAPWILFLVWPILLLCFELHYIIILLRNYLADRRSSTTTRRQASSSGKSTAAKCCSGFNVMDLPNAFITGFFSNISHVAAVCFSVCVIAWFSLYLMVSRDQVYPVVIAMVVGWLFTITFLKGFESVHAFAIMLSLIIVRDITRFLLIYIFVLIAFALGLHSLFIVVPEMSQTYPTVWDSIFVTFNLMLGADSIFEDDNFDDYYLNAGVNPLYVKIVYIIYMILAAIILLNLLIAMMSDTYNGIKSREGTTWRVGSMRLALRVERSLPFIRKSLIRLGCVDHGVTQDGDRWVLHISRDEIRGGKREKEIDDTSRSLQRLENKLSQLGTAFDDLRRYVGAAIDENEANAEASDVTSLQHVSVTTRSRARPRSARKLQSPLPHRSSKL